MSNLLDLELERVETLGCDCCSWDLDLEAAAGALGGVPRNPSFCIVLPTGVPGVGVSTAVERVPILPVGGIAGSLGRDWEEEVWELSCCEASAGCFELSLSDALALGRCGVVT